MRPLRVTHKRQRHWSRRAKPDGSAVPKLKGVRLARRSRWYRQYLFWTWFLWVAAMLVPVLGIQIFILVMKLDIKGMPLSSFLSLYKLPSPFDLFGIWLRYAFIVVQIGLVLLLVSLIRFLLGYRSSIKHAVAHRCHLCPRCGYSLQARTNDTQPCPECGQRISRREAVRLWCRFCAR